MDAQALDTLFDQVLQAEAPQELRALLRSLPAVAEQDLRPPPSSPGLRPRPLAVARS
jgi:hypothetical protein